jgi:hypothetical protein
LYDRTLVLPFEEVNTAVTEVPFAEVDALELGELHVSSEQLCNFLELSSRNYFGCATQAALTIFAPPAPDISVERATRPSGFPSGTVAAFDN